VTVLPSQPDEPHGFCAPGRVVSGRSSSGHDRAAFPQLRRALSGHLSDVGDFVEFHQPDAARRAMELALCIAGELDHLEDAA